MSMTVTDTHAAQDPANRPHKEQVQELTSLMSHCRPRFHRIALRCLGDVADAEDAVQDAFLSAYRYLHQFNGQAQMSTWLTRIVINSARTKQRRRPRQLHISLDGADRVQDSHPISDRLPDRRPSPEEICRTWELAKHLAQLSTRLPPNLLRTFQLHDVNGLSIRESAHILGVKESTVRARAARARTKLKRLAQESLGGRRRAILWATPPIGTQTKEPGACDNDRLLESPMQACPGFLRNVTGRIPASTLRTQSK